MILSGGGYNSTVLSILSMNLTKNQKLIYAGITILVLAVAVFTGYYLIKIQPHNDNRETACSKKTIESIEYNITAGACFTKKISACQTPTYISLEACQKANQGVPIIPSVLEIGASSGSEISTSTGTSNASGTLER